MAERRLYAPSALLPEGWRSDVLFEFGDDGSISSVETSVARDGVELAGGPVIPAMGNLHSHAFQRAMAGLAERTGPGDDSFWTWRDVMYGFLAKLTPDDLEAIAAQLYIEMLKAGYGTVGEFHYLHHGPDGTPYDDLAEMSARIIAAGEQTGIAVTLLPVLYGYSGFGGQEAGVGQRRFLNNPTKFAELLQQLHLLVHRSNNLSLGIAPHSLRAVTKETLAEVISVLNSLDPSAPIHTHIAEQVKEVKDCVAWSGKRPVEWLYENFEVDRRWCLVHATHMTEAETTRLAKSGAVAGLCPTTEANLGDGLFPAVDFMKAGGTFGIGSDSHISVSPIEELRWLEYGQRLAYQARNLLASGEGASLGTNLYCEALKGGARALGRRTGLLQEGSRADLLVLDQESAILTGKYEEALLDAVVFSGNVNTVRHVMVGACWLIRDGRHAKEEEIGSRYRACLKRLTA